MFLLLFTKVESTKLTWVTENLKRKRKDTLIYAWKTDPKMMTRVFTMKSHTHVSHWLTQPHVVSSGSDRSQVSVCFLSHALSFSSDWGSTKGNNCFL